MNTNDDQKTTCDDQGNGRGKSARAKIHNSPAPALTTGGAANGTPVGQQRRRGGAPRRNRNAYRHGLYSPRGPKASKYAERQAGIFRRHLEACIVAEHGEISIVDACLIDTATQAARMALDELRELREAYDALDTGQRSAKRQSAAKFLDLRDRKIRELGITWRPMPDAGQEIDPFKAIDEENQLPEEARA